jgi:hypothetical protein
LADMTITEALAELKTIAKRLEKKREFVYSHLVYHASMKDPLTKDGGAATVLERERQGVADLEVRVVAIRTAIQRANLATMITVEGETKTIAEWLAWRKDVMPERKRFIGTMFNTIQQRRKEFTQKAAATPEDIVVNVDERALADAGEQLETIVATLDGQLSLKNATTTVTV